MQLIAMTMLMTVTAATSMKTKINESGKDDDDKDDGNNEHDDDSA